MTNYVCCCECAYQDICFNCDAFGGCAHGKQKEKQWNLLTEANIDDQSKDF